MDRPNVSVGDKDVALANEIIRVEVGSGAHGMAVEGTDDIDIMGVYVETREQLLGLAPSSEHYVSRTQPEGERSGPGDVDLTLYSLRKYMRLATAGNPTVLTLLFVEPLVEPTAVGYAVQALKTEIVSRKAGHRYLGYLDGQRMRMLGQGPRQNRVPKRPELIERHGYDTKYASHALRLALQGIELMKTGRLSLPMLESSLSVVRQVKTGQVDQKTALYWIDVAREELVDILGRESLPIRDEPNMDAINSTLVSMHQWHWTMN